MNQAWKILTEVAKDMPCRLPVFNAFLIVWLCAALPFLLHKR